MQTPEDLFVVRARITVEQDRVRAENGVRSARGPGRGARGRAWLGRRLIAMGTFLGGDAAAGDRSLTGRPS